ncbi:MAG: myristoyl transferase [Opitutus sp.]|nr:myristoyl transferase [Opitutus sp.]
MARRLAFGVMTQTFSEVARARSVRLVSSPMPPVARIVCLTLLAAIVAGCGRQDAPKRAAGEKPALRKVILQTDWFPQAEHGGFYQALARGFYAQAGLEVEIWPGGPGSGIKLKVAKGEADFGMNRSDDIFLAASRGLPLVMVAATMQHDSMALMVREDSPVKTFRDLDGRVVIGNVGMAYLPFLERKFGIKFEKRQNTYGLGEFLANPDVIQQCVVTSEPFFAQQHGRKVRTLSLAASGYDSYHAIFCRRELTRQAPDVVRAFVHASIRGWRDYLDGDPTPADALILKGNAQASVELLHFSRSEMIIRSLVQGDRAKGEDIGQLSMLRLSQEMDVLLNLKIMEIPLVVSTVATREFLPATPLR